MKKGLMLIARSRFPKRRGKLFYDLSEKTKMITVSGFHPVSFYSFFTKKSNNAEEFKKQADEKLNKSDEMLLNMNFEGAKQLLEELVEECKAFYKAENYPDRHTHIMRIFFTLFNMGFYEKAETLLNQTVTDLEKNSSNMEDKKNLSQSYSGLSRLNAFRGNKEKALEYGIRAYQIIKENDCGDVENLLLSERLFHLGELRLNMNKTQEAIIIFEECLKLKEDSVQRLGFDQQIPSLCKIYEKLGSIHSMLGNRELSEKYFLSAMGLHIQISGEDSLDIPPLYVQLAELNIKYKEWDKALNNLKEGQKILDKLSKAKKTAPVLKIEGSLNFGFVLYHTNKGEAEMAFKYLNLYENNVNKKSWEKTSDQQYYITVKLCILRHLEKYEEMEKFLEEALIHNKNIYNDKENEVSFYTIYYYYGLLSLHKEDLGKAIEYSWKAYNIAAAVNNVMVDEWCIGENLAVIYFAYYEQGKLPEAIEYGNRAFEILKKFPHTRGTAEIIIEGLAQVYDAHGDKPKCLLYLKEFKTMLLEDLANAPKESQADIKMLIEEVDAKISEKETG